jgi:uncharacterized protein YqeY
MPNGNVKIQLEESTMELKEQLRKDMAAAMRAGVTERRDTLRMLLAAIKQVEIDEQTALDDNGVRQVIAKQAKQRRESIADYEVAGRPDMVASETTELKILEAYLPQMLSSKEVEALATAVITELGVTNMKGMGQVMGILMPQLKGKADGRVVNEVVRALLQQQ